MRSASALLLVAGALVLGACGGGGGGSATQSSAEGACATVAKPKPRPAPHLQAPTERLAAGSTYRVLVQTSCGDFTITLDQKTSPATTASFVSLVRKGYFDNTSFHRIVPDFVIQAGDPTGTGAGGPGYSTVDRPPKGTVYLRNTVAMAKTSAEAPGTAGSQFFVVTAPNAHLPPEYAVLGKITAGQDVVARIGRLGTVMEQKPTRPIVIEKMTVQVS
ncbi:MAG TPA: peptidylprolyl isomerase [Gaiellaceae bacterium]